MIDALKKQIQEYFVGREDVVENLLICLLAGGHVLLEDVPGVGKTTLARTLSRTIECDFGRIQFTPDTMPGEFPPSIQSPRDFLEDFVFRSQKGYCAHFATAFVLMARSQGIPARYVQGFYVKKESYGTVMVTSDMAHAWPEAYLEGVGWVSFEPTPGYMGSGGWEMTKRSGEEETGEPQEEPDRRAEGPVVSAPPVDDPVSEQEPRKSGRKIPWKYLGIPLLLCLLFFGISLGIYRTLAKHWYDRLDDREKLLIMCRRNLRILELLGKRLEDGETLEEFGERLRKEDFGEASRDLPGFLKLYGKLSYSAEPVTEEMRREGEKANAGLMERLKQRKGIRYFWYRIARTGFSSGKRS